MKERILLVIVALTLTSLIPLSIESDPVSDVEINSLTSKLIDSMDVYTKHGYDVSRIVDPFVYKSEVLTEGHLPLVLDIKASKDFDLDGDRLNNLVSKNERYKQGFGEITYAYKILMNETYFYDAPAYRDEPYQYNATYWVNETGDNTSVSPEVFEYYNITWDDCYNVTTNGTRLVLDHYETIEDYRYVWRETENLEVLSFKANSKIIVDVQGNFKASIGSKQVDVVPVINIATYSKELTEYAWWNSNWAYSKRVTINHSYIYKTLINFPVLFDNTSSDYEKSQTDGDDFAFVDSTNTTQFAHEIEWFNVSDDNRLIAWANITTVSNTSDTILYLYYGNAGCGSQQNPTGVWDSSYKIVQHMDGADLAGTDDSTSNYNNATEQGGAPSYQQTGKIGYGVTLDGDDWVCFGDDNSIKPTTITVEAWFNTDTVAAGAKTIFQMPYTSGAGWDDPWVAYGLILSGSGPACHINVDGVGGYKSLGAGSVVTGIWYYMAMTYDGEDHKQYLNTSLIDSGSYAGSVAYGTPYLATGIKNPNATSSQEFWNGLVDELRVSSGGRNASWIGATYNTTSNPSTFLTVGIEQTGNASPIFSNPNPAHESTGVPISTTTWNITIKDPEGDTFNWTIETLPDIGSNSSNDDTNGSKEVNISGNLSYNIHYTVYVNATDAGSNAWTNETFWFETKVNLSPVFSSPVPANESTGISILTAIWNITIKDPEGDTFNWTIETSPDIGSNSSNNNVNGSKEVNISGNLSYTTHYTVFVNATDAESGRWTNETFWFETQVEYVPVISNPFPVNGSLGANLQETISVYVSDPDGDLMNVYWYENTTDGFVLRQTNASVGNGTYYYVFTQADTYNTKYWWKVAANDSIFNTTAIYYFTTRSTGYVSISNVIPANGAIAVEIVGNPPESTGYVDLYFTLNDSRGGNDMSFYLNVSVNGVWVNRVHQTSVGNMTLHQMEDTFNTTNTTYWWNVSYRDGTDPYTNNLFHFRSEARPDPPDTPSPVNMSKVENGDVTLKCVVRHPDASAPSPPVINVTFYEWPAGRVIGYDNSSLLSGQTSTCDTPFSAPYNGTKYYWFTVARDDEFNSDNSSVWFFETYYNDTEPSAVWYSTGGDIFVEVGAEPEPNATWYSTGGDIWVEPLYVEPEPSNVWYSSGGNISIYHVPTFSNPIPSDDAVNQWINLMLSIDVNTTTAKYKNFTTRPDEAGSKAGLNISGAAENWQCVDEAAPDDDATFVYTNSTNLYADDSHSLSNYTVAQHGDQLNVTVFFRCKNYNSSDTGDVEPTIKTHGSFYNGTTVSLTDSWATYSYMWDLNPNTNQEWTWDEIDDLEAGISMVFGNCTQVYVNVSYRNEIPMLTTQFYTNATVDESWVQIDSDISEQRTNYTATMLFSGLQFSSDYWWYVRVFNTTLPINQSSSIYHFTTIDPPSEPSVIWYAMGGDLWVEPLYTEVEPSIIWYSTGGATSIYLMVGFTNETPVDGTTGLWRNVILSAWASKDGEPVHYDFTFYTNDTHDGNWSEIGTLTQQITNLTVTIPFSGLEWNKTYWWKVVAVNDTLGTSTSSAVWYFKTNYSIAEPNIVWYTMGGKIQIGYNPAVSNPYPADGSAFGIQVLGDFSVLVTDPDNDTLNVTFYNASDDSVFGTANNIPNNTRASVSAPIVNMTNYTWFEWYIVVNDSVFSTTSDTWRYKPGNSGPTGNFTPWEGDTHVQVRRKMTGGGYEYFVRLIWNITDVEGDEIQFHCQVIVPPDTWDPVSNWTSRWHSTGYNGTYFHDEEEFVALETIYSWRMDLNDSYNSSTHYMNFTTDFLFWSNFNWTPYRAATNGNILFIDESVNATGYWWYVNGMLVANASGLSNTTQFNMNHTFNISNVYNVTLKVYNKTCLNYDRLTRYIYVDRNLSLNRSSVSAVTYYGQSPQGDMNASTLCNLLNITSNAWVHKYNTTTGWQSYWVDMPNLTEDFNLSLWDALAIVIGQNYSKRINITESPDQREEFFSRTAALENMSNASQLLVLPEGYNYICWSNVTNTTSYNLSIGLVAAQDRVYKYNTQTNDFSTYWYAVSGEDFAVHSYDILILNLGASKTITIGDGFNG